MYLGPTKVDYTEVAAVSGHFEPPICIHNVQAAQSLRQLPPGIRCPRSLVVVVKACCSLRSAGFEQTTSASRTYDQQQQNISMGKLALFAATCTCNSGIYNNILPAFSVIGHQKMESE